MKRIHEKNTNINYLIQERIQGVRKGLKPESDSFFNLDLNEFSLQILPLIVVC